MGNRTSTASMRVSKLVAKFGNLRLSKGKKKKSANRLPKSSSEHDSPYFRIQQLTGQIFKLENDLQKSNKKVDLLTAQLAEYDVLLAHSQNRNADTPSSRPPTFQIEERRSEQDSYSVSPKMNSPRVWIDDLWLCNDTENTPIQEAEAYWKNGSPKNALEIVSQAIDSNPFLSPAEEIRCRVFGAAVLHSMGQFEVSSRRLEVILETAARYSILDDPRCKDIVGIAYYVFGRNSLEMGRFSEAYYLFSRALGTSGYHEKTREYQKSAVVEFTRQSAMADCASISSSLRPVVCVTEYDSSEELP
ncbi:hypothetical protein N7456_003441 [Penicillium angulare]|uniref:Tetratricopeptide-like helical n=1 Tax=Penicillium angulare TaxID=116970 RepID=A0A9W9FUM4_9EURO|nr:hypothetical protein N7456_003441 [Penicillium angulare]